MTWIERDMAKPAPGGKRLRRRPAATTRPGAGARAGLAGMLVVSVPIWALVPALALAAMLLIDVALPSREPSSILGAALALAGLGAARLLLHGLRRRLARQTADALLRPPGTPETDDACRALTTLGGDLADALVQPLVAVVALALLDWPLALVATFGVALVFGALLLQYRGEALRWRQLAPLAANRDVRWRLAAANPARLGDLGLDAAWRAHCHQATLDHDRVQRKLEPARHRARDAVRALAVLLLAANAGTAAYLVALDRAELGGLAAALLLSGSALAPLLIVSRQVPELLAGRAALLARRAAVATVDPLPLALPAPSQSLSIEHVTLMHPGAAQPLLSQLDIGLVSGDVLAIAGTAGSGKSLLLRLLTGTIRPTAGTIRIDGAALEDVARDDLARHIGYMSQLPLLMPGTVLQNIGRFDPLADPRAVIGAARSAGVHEAILRLPQGYETELDLASGALNPSFMQRLALARASYGDPFVLLLDAPGAWQDRAGLNAIARCIVQHRARGGIVVFTGVEPALLETANLLLVLEAGRGIEFGPKNEVRERMAARHAATKMSQKPRTPAATAQDSE